MGKVNLQALNQQFCSVVTQQQTFTVWYNLSQDLDHLIIFDFIIGIELFKISNNKLIQLADEGYQYQNLADQMQQVYQQAYNNLEAEQSDGRYFIRKDES